MKHFRELIPVLGMFVCLAGCESVTEGPTSPASSARSSTTARVVDEPRPVDIPTKPGSEDQNSLPHGQPDRPQN